MTTSEMAANMAAISDFSKIQIYRENAEIAIIADPSFRLSENRVIDPKPKQNQRGS